MRTGGNKKIESDSEKWEYYISWFVQLIKFKSGTSTFLIKFVPWYKFHGNLKLDHFPMLWA